jgi:NCAIR mutase (PurE)-related protein
LVLSKGRSKSSRDFLFKWKGLRKDLGAKKIEKNKIIKILKDLKNEKISVEEAYNFLKILPFSEIEDIKIDTHRVLRKGISEIIYGEGKNLEQLKKIIDFHLKNDIPFLITRLSEENYKKLKIKNKSLKYHKIARALQYKKLNHFTFRGKIGIITAGASDIEVAEEVLTVCRFFSEPAELFTDMGVAGIHRLTAFLKERQKFSAIVAIAGMEGALPSVIAGLVSCPVIGVPTSAGYGTNLKGFVPLLTMLSSCTASVAVVGIDNGVAAGIFATLINCLDEGGENF